MTFIPFQKDELLNIQSYMQFPRELLKEPEYSALTPDAMLLYSLFLDRIAQSLKYENKKIHFFDDKGNVFIIFKQADAMEKLHIKRGKYDSARKLLEEAGLIKEIKQGKNLPNIIYVGKTKRMSEAGKIINMTTAKNQQPGMSNTSTPDCKNSAVYNKYNYINKYNKNTGFDNRFFEENHQYDDLDKFYVN